MLADILIKQVQHCGPMDLAQFMGLCLGHADYGYYQKQQPFGAEGDFITAPELTPLFGEMLGIWAAHQWQNMGQPAPMHLIELGPGNGTLMADVIRTISRIAPALAAQLNVHLVETSARLRTIQAEQLAALQGKLHWHADVGTIPDGHSLWIANEFFDALPIRQYVYQNGSWHERCIGLNAQAQLEWQLQPRLHVPYPFPDQLTAATEGAIIEYCPAAEGIIHQIALRLKAHSGAALIIDYGYFGPAFGDTFQAVYKHQYTDPLTRLGEADLTAHVDFGALALWAQQAGINPEPLTSQSEFLQSMGIIARYEQVMPSLTTERQAILTSAIERLLAPEHMGELFKVLCLQSN